MQVKRSRSRGFAAAFSAALLLALFPVAGHALSLCVCADGDVSLEAECIPQHCCDDTHETAAVETVPHSTDAAASECAEVPLLPDSERFDRSAAPTGYRVIAPGIAVHAQLHSVIVALPTRIASSPPAPELHPNHWESIRSTVLLV